MKTTKAMAALVLVTALVWGGCGSRQRDPSAELDASTPRAVRLPYDQVFTAVVGAAMDCGYTPTHADRQKGELAACMVGRFDPAKTAKAAGANAGRVAVEVGVGIAEFAVALAAALAGGSGSFNSHSHFGGAEWASDMVGLGLLVRLEEEGGVRGGVTVRAIVVAPGSEGIEAEFTEKFWAALRGRAPLAPP
ncbi:MAG: hypothetical protein IT437_01560 [Phycisphaerales bacterium]|nr:hypothetical protein [Phycisphaerales bacterium]